MSRTSAVEPAIRNGLCYVMFAYDTAFSILLDKWEASVIRKLQTLESIYGVAWNFLCQFRLGARK